MRLKDAAVTPSVLPGFLQQREYRLPRDYIGAILDLPRKKGTRVVFLYTPRHGGPAPPPYERLYTAYPLIDPEPLPRSSRIWADATHFNRDGSRIPTDFLADELARSGYLSPQDPLTGSFGESISGRVQSKSLDPGLSGVKSLDAAARRRHSTK